jgi:hypothetical protein
LRRKGQESGRPDDGWIAFATTPQPRRIAPGLIAMAATPPFPGDRPAGPGGDRLSEVARTVLAHRRLRATLLPADMFGEWGWDALLELFVADAEGRQLTGQMLADRLGCPPQTMLRWLRYLLAADLIVGGDDLGLPSTLTLSPRAISVLECYFTATRADAQRVLQQG